MTNQESAPFEQHPIQDSASSRKRSAMRMSERRPTAKGTVQRPPATASRSPYSGCFAMLLIGAFLFLMAATVMLTAAMMMGASTEWRQVRENWTAWISRREPQNVMSARTNSNPFVPGEQRLTANGQRIVLEDDFSQPHAPLAEVEMPERWLTGFVVDQNLYRMRVWRGYTAWSRLHFEQAAPFRLEADSVIAQETQRGYAGFLSRFRDDANYLLFAVDGEGRFNVLRQQNGVWNTLQPWTDSDAIQLAGEHNVLALHDDGRTISFWCNDTLLFAMVPEPEQLEGGAIGDVALIAGSKPSSSSDVAEVNYHWLRLIELSNE